MSDDNKITGTGIQDKERSFKFWSTEQLFRHSKNGRHVPNPGDFVADATRGWLIVRDVDYTTGTSVLDRWNVAKSNTEQGENDLLLGAGPGHASESYRLFVDRSVTPHVITPEKRLHLYGSDVEYYKLFLGTDYGNNGKVIGFVRDTNGTILGENIPFEAVEIPGSVQTTIRTPTSAYTTESLEDGERVTLVGYTKEGHQCSINVLVVLNSGTTRHLESSRKYVRGIGIDSPFISGSDPHVIEFPTNVFVQHLPMIGVVYYSDGSKEQVPLDGGRFTLFGIENYSATVPEEVFDLVLTYRLSGNEIAYEQSPTANRKITRSYQARTIEADGAYSVKLFPYPVWEPDSGTYRMEYWLYNLDRKTFYNVTSKIELGSNSEPFNPTLYGTLQTLTVALDLSRVDYRFKPIRHHQTFQVTLMARGTERTTNWLIKFRPGQDAAYGNKLSAKLTLNSTNAWKLDLKNDAVSKQVWLNKLYYGVEPLYNSSTEALPPEPTHFRIQTLHNTYERKVEQWDQVFDIVNDLRQGEVLYITWIYRTDSTDLQLAVTGLPVHIQSN